MEEARVKSSLQALAAAALFGVSPPLAKLLLGSVEPIPLAALLYLGSAAGLAVLRGRDRALHRDVAEAGIRRADAPWLIGAAMCGGVAAPIVLMYGLRSTPAATASLLLNFESAATALLAALIFGEAVDRRVWLAVACITGAGIVLTWNGASGWGLSLGAAGIIVACLLWGLDNNLTRNISAKDTTTITMVKGLVAGSFSLAIALVLRQPLPDLAGALGAMALGFFSYGLSIALFIRAMRGLGAAMTGAFFSTAPFIGASLALILARSWPDPLFLAALPLMLVGSALLLGGSHRHAHAHAPLTHEHSHAHGDSHHMHTHTEEPPADRPHSHQHRHDPLVHDHAHAPDIHHRHGH